tara:strand:+ start:733 stop:900 length:168 start_codon:yes stop_codon:yes gene_type:complete
MITTKDPGKAHFYISLVKSSLRIAGCLVAAYSGSVIALAFFLGLAEVLGIAEEIF